MNRLMHKILTRFRVDAIGVAMPGPRLPQRIRRIVEGRLSEKISPASTALLAIACLAICAVVTAVLLAGAQSRVSSQTGGHVSGTFDAISIKPSTPAERHHNLRWQPGRFIASNLSVDFLVEAAYGIRSEQLEGLPPWAESRGYTIQAVMPSDMPRLTPQQTVQLRRQMLQSLLTDRFRLQFHRTTKLLAVYEIVVAKGGPKLATYSQSKGAATGEWASSDGVKFVGVTTPFLAYFFSTRVGRLVIDKTGLAGRYDFTLKAASWSPNPVAADSGAESSAPPQSDFSGESVFTAMKEQLGLELKAAKEPVKVLVIDRIEQPTPN